MTTSISVQESDIPLDKLPHAVARLIQKEGDAVYRISVVRTHWHHYNVSVRTKAIRKENRPARVVMADTARTSDSCGMKAQGNHRGSAA